ncbi:hypothetical protein FQZ97_946970 [compost metagenome]
MVSRLLRTQLLLVSKLSKRTLTKVKLATTLVFSFVVSSANKLSVDRFLRSQVQLLHTQSLTLKCTSLRKKKVAATLHSLRATSHSSTSVLLT